MMYQFLTSIVVVALLTPSEGFVAPSPWLTASSSQQLLSDSSSLMMAGQKKRRRRRKEKEAAAPVVANVEAAPPVVPETLPESVPVKENAPQEDLAAIKDVAGFEFKEDDILKGIEDQPQAQPMAPVQSDDSAIPLPDIREARRKKEMEEELARMEAEREEKRPKIKRSDKEAFARLLEQQPFADADDSYFEEQEYTLVSALLGERAEKFIGIPTGPLQVGHFIGALGILLMAFVEYPGFPLTNLPTPLRGALQGGLGVVYAINTVLAVLAAFAAIERGQPVPLWITKTWAVGGLAYDQLTQLPKKKDK